MEIQSQDLILIHEEKAKRATWKVGVVEEVIKGQDGEIRGAKVRRVGKGKTEMINCPVQKLVPLEIACKKSLESEKVEEGQDEGKSVVEEKEEVQGCKLPTRVAARNARAKTKLMIDS